MKFGWWAFLFLAISLFSVVPEAYAISNRAGVAWTVSNDRPDFDETPAIAKRILTDNDGAFQIPPDQFIPVSPDAAFSTDSLMVAVDEALTKLRGVNNPYLVLVLHSHGKGAAFRRVTDKRVDIPYREIFKRLLASFSTFQKTEGKKIQVLLLLSACESGNALPLLKEIWGNAFIADVFTSADKKRSSHANWFLEQIEVLSKAQSLGSLLHENSWAPFFLPLSHDHHQFWSNHREPPRLSKDQLPEMLALTAYLVKVQATDLHPVLHKDIRKNTAGYIATMMPSHDERRAALEQLADHGDVMIRNEARAQLERL